MGVAGKIALITGGAQGLGKAFADALLRNGAKVCIADFNPKVGSKTVDEFEHYYGKYKASFVKCDVTNKIDLQDAFIYAKGTFGGLDIVSNGAGIVDERDWRKCVDVNLNGVIGGTELGILHMRKDIGGHGGVIVNISSTAGLFPVFFAPVYSSTKHAVVGLTQSWAVSPDVKRMGIRFTCLCPSFTDTAMLHFDPKKMIHQDLAADAVKKLGINPISKVVEGFMKLVQDKDNNGSILTVTTQDGISYSKRSLGKSML